MAAVIKELNRHLAQVSEGLEEHLAGAEEAAVPWVPHAHQVNQQISDSVPEQRWAPCTGLPEFKTSIALLPFLLPGLVVHTN